MVLIVMMQQEVLILIVVVFNNAMNTAIYEGSGKQLKVEAPFINLHKKIL